ncbi:hypothetical protein POM88_004631 [Heracleum sosnowskyi]|uniref:Uncharacterized protein n=1 Tax=Heracleum sosnowskyi TaxID=360622 RepID=A0AAD8JLV4_9APIA|nr:hypothetical protein POM88_004631 [Heracleum sosnowskyi]
MEGVSSRLGRASSRYGGSAPVFTGPVRKWKKQWTPVPNSTDKSVKTEPELPRRKFRYAPIVGVEDLKKEVDKRVKDEAVTSKTSQSSPRVTNKKGGIFRKQDIDSLFMEVSQASRNDQDDNSDGEDQ